MSRSLAGIEIVSNRFGKIHRWFSSKKKSSKKLKLKLKLKGSCYSIFRTCSIKRDNEKMQTKINGINYNEDGSFVLVGFVLAGSIL
jgi:hypothetical protein